MAFYRGQKVVFVGWATTQSPAAIEHRLKYPYRDPEVGAVYTIANTYIYSDGDLMLELAEFEDGHEAWAPGWTSDGFRPVVDRSTDISVFTEILRKATKRQGADA